MSSISAEEQAFIKVVADWVDTEVRPRARDLEHANEYPAEFIDTMKHLGIYGLSVPAEFGGNPVSTGCYVQITEELARGWMTLSGAVGGHSVICHIIARFGTERQKQQWLPQLAAGHPRATMALTEPGGGSDLQNMRTVARRSGDRYVINGSKIWITNARRAGLIGLLCKTDPTAEPKHTGMSVFLLEPGPGVKVSRDLPKLGYKGVESCEVQLDDVTVPAESILGGTPGAGFSQMMHGLELGRIQVASRAVGVARAAYEDSLAYAQSRESFGQPIWKHQSIGNYLADMAIRLEAARLMTREAATKLDAGIRCDAEVGMAKVFASEACLQTTLDAIRIHGGNGYSTEFDVERYFRDAPLMAVGEGTNEIQKQIIARQIVSRNRVSQR